MWRYFFLISFLVLSTSAIQNMKKLLDLKKNFYEVQPHFISHDK